MDTATPGVGSSTGGIIGAPFPPRPKAIATFLSSRSFLPGCQTMLHSLKTHLAPTPKDEYPPEITVLLSSKLKESNDEAAAVKDLLSPIFCDRIVVVEHIPIATDADAEDGGESKPSHVKAWDENCGWTKLRLFELECYDTILYIDADCLVTNDVGHLLSVDDTVGEKRVGLLAAAPDIFPPDKFNAGVMVLRPSQSVFDEMMARLPNSNAKGSAPDQSCTSYDGGDTGFLNSFYPGWYSEMPAYSRLSFGCNAQRFMHQCTYAKQPKYWDDAIEDIGIIHFSSSPKPWETKAEKSNGKAKDQQSYLDGEDTNSIEKVAQSGKLEKLWHAAYEKSQTYHAKELSKQAKKRRVAERKAQSAAAPARSATPAARAKPQDAHRMVHKLFKELRKTGMSMQEAMAAARAEYGLDKADGRDPSKAVGQMFGLM